MGYKKFVVDIFLQNRSVKFVDFYAANRHSINNVLFLYKLNYYAINLYNKYTKYIMMITKIVTNKGRTIYYSKFDRVVFDTCIYNELETNTKYFMAVGTATTDKVVRPMVYCKIAILPDKITDVNPHKIVNLNDREEFFLETIRKMNPSFKVVDQIVINVGKSYLEQLAKFFEDNLESELSLIPGYVGKWERKI